MSLLWIAVGNSEQCCSVLEVVVYCNLGADLSDLWGSVQIAVGRMELLMEMDNCWAAGKSLVGYYHWLLMARADIWFGIQDWGRSLKAQNVRLSVEVTGLSEVVAVACKMAFLSEYFATNSTGFLDLDRRNLALVIGMMNWMNFVNLGLTSKYYRCSPASGLPMEWNSKSFPSQRLFSFVRRLLLRYSTPPQRKPPKSENNSLLHDLSLSKSRREEINQDRINSSLYR